MGAEGEHLTLCFLCVCKKRSSRVCFFFLFFSKSEITMSHRNMTKDADKWNTYLMSDSLFIRKGNQVIAVNLGVVKK